MPGPGLVPRQRRRYAVIHRRASRPEGAEVGRGGGRREDVREGPGVARDLLNPNPGGTTLTNPYPSRGARTLVLAGPALALLATVFAFATGTGLRFLCGIWFAAALWTFLAALAGVLWRGFRHGDWSSLNSYELPEENGDRFDSATRTGRYAWLHDLEDEELHGHDPGAPFP